MADAEAKRAGGGGFRWFAGLVCGLALALQATTPAEAAIDIDPDHRLVAAGGSLITRLTADGRFDETFDRNGYLKARGFDIGAGRDGSIYLAGRGNQLIAISPLGHARTIDIEAPPGAGRLFAYYVTPLPSGQLLLAGVLIRPEPCDGGTSTLDRISPAVARVDADGTFDTGFGGGDGIAEVSPETDSCSPPAADFQISPVVLPDGSIIAAGLGTLAKFTPSGQPDSNFGGGDGVVRPRYRITNLQVSDDGHLNVGGFGTWPLVARFLPNGDPDPAFAGGQAVEGYGSLVLPASGDRVLVAGSRGTSNCYTGSCSTDLKITRLLGDASLDQTFGDGDGQVQIPLSFGFSPMEAVRSTSGSVLESYARFRRWGTGGSALVAVTEEGELDKSFSDDGIAVPPQAPKRCGGRKFPRPWGGLGSPEPDRFRAELARHGSNIFFGFGGDDRFEIDVGNLDPDDEPSPPGQAFVCAGGGDDVVRTGRTEQVVLGGRGDDQISTARGADTAVGGPGRDRLRGGRGNDLLLSRDDFRDVVRCGQGVDRVRADRRDRLHGCEVRL